MSKMKTFQPGNFNNDIGGPMGLIVSRSWFVTTNHHLFSWPLLTFDCFNFSCWIVSLTVVQNKIILFQEAPPGVYDMTILAYFLTILRYWTIFFDDITISSEKNDDTAILTKQSWYDDIDQKMDDIDQKMDDTAILVNESIFVYTVNK